MRKQSIHTDFVIYDSRGELPAGDRELLDAATGAISNAYAPYSHFRVGAAVLLEGGTVVTGNNQENAAYPSGMCAERVAVWNASSQYPDKKILKIAISVRSELKTIDKPVAPCGACRQTLLEYEYKQHQPVEVLFTGETGVIVKAPSLSALLPFGFDESYL